MITKNKIFILGDSFSHNGAPSPEGISVPDVFWPEILHESLKDTYDLIVDAYPSRDMQTILDNWTKLIPLLKPDDIIIIAIPFFTRFRVPLSKNDYKIVEWGDNSIINRFVTHHSWYHNSSEKIYLNNTPVSKKELDEKTHFFERMFFENESVEKNYNEVVESLYKLTPCRKYLFSWDNMKYKTDIIEYQKDIKDKIGWSTLHDLYLEIGTNPDIYNPGRVNDFHWDYRFHNIFANYMIDKFKK